MTQFRRGISAPEERQGGGKFRPISPDIRWSKDGASRFLLILTPPDELYEFERLHEYVPTGTFRSGKTRFDAFLSRKEPAIGENYDDLEDRLGQRPKRRAMGVAVELDAVLETVKGRQRPASFTVQTSTFTRNGDDGEVEVTQPALALITQHPTIFWGWPEAYHNNSGPIQETPVQVSRRGMDTNTRYDWLAFEDKPVDFTPLISNFEGITYLRDKYEDIEKEVAAATTDLEAAQAIADTLLEYRLNELSDWERYKQLVGPIKVIPNRFGPTPAPEAPKGAGLGESGLSNKLDEFRKLKKRVE